MPHQRRVLASAALGVLLGAIACGSEGNPNPEIVMKEGMRITANAPEGTITIIAGKEFNTLIEGKGFKRTYQWDECSKAVTLHPRPARWLGSLGIVSSGSGWTWWFSCGGLSGALVQEGQQHFKTLEEAQTWVDSTTRTLPPPVYRNDGLVVAWEKIRSRGALAVDVWQIYIEGEKPSHLDGANDDSISVTEPASSD